jgi:hypothetical protein
LDGKRFFPETGIPILNNALKMVRLEVWLPEPFIVPTVIEKLFTTGLRFDNCSADINTPLFYYLSWVEDAFG